jgi:hypothetical protein
MWRDALVLASLIALLLAPPLLRTLGAWPWSSAAHNALILVLLATMATSTFATEKRKLVRIYLFPRHLSFESTAA